METKLFKMMYNVGLPFFVFFAAMCSVKAFESYGITDNLYKTCSAENNCVPICIYKDNSGKERAMIGYYYDYNAPEFDNDHSGWEISIFNGLEQVYTNKGQEYEDLRKVFYVRHRSLPYTDIYFATPGSLKQDEWNGSAQYQKATNLFECPEYFYVDKQYNEVCLSNELGSCPKINNFATRFKDDNAFSLKYKFTDELSYTLHTAYSNAHLDDSNSVDTATKIRFLKDLDSKFSDSYDEGLTEEENALNYCDTFAEEINSDSGKSYTNRLMTNLGSSNYFNNLNEKLQEATKNTRNSSLIRNSELYYYDKLSKVLTYDVTESSKKYKHVDFERIDTVLLNDNFNNSYKYVEYICKQKKNVDISHDSNQISSVVDDLYKEWTYVDPKVDIKTTYDCSILSDFADVISTGYFILEMVGLAILIIFSILDYVKIFLNDNADELKKTNSRFIKRLIILVILFVLPALINTILNIFSIEGFNSEDPLCREVVNFSNK